MRGNGLNCLRIAPYSAVQFTTYEFMKRIFSQMQGSSTITADGTRKPLHQLSTSEKLISGAVAGFTSVVSTYPLDLVRSRISIASASMYTSGGKSKTVLPHVPGVWETTLKVYRVCLFYTSDASYE